MLDRMRDLERPLSGGRSALGPQRQIDEQNKKFGDTISLRHALQQMHRRIDQLEASRRAALTLLPGAPQPVPAIDWPPIAASSQTLAVVPKGAAAFFV